jgi:hypothetical protein
MSANWRFLLRALINILSFIPGKMAIYSYQASIMFLSQIPRTLNAAQSFLIAFSSPA